MTKRASFETDDNERVELLRKLSLLDDMRCEPASPGATARSVETGASLNADAFRAARGTIGSSIKAWAFGIWRNVVDSHCRIQRRHFADRPQQTAAALELLTEVSEKSDLEPEAQLARQHQVELAQRGLDELPDDLRIVLWLIDVEALPVSEAAAALGWNVHTTSTRLLSARQEFARNLQRTRGNSEAFGVAR